MTTDQTPEKKSKRPTTKQVVGWLITLANAIWHWLQRRATAIAAAALVAAVAAFAVATIGNRGDVKADDLRTLAADLETIRTTSSTRAATDDLAKIVEDLDARLGANAANDMIAVEDLGARIGETRAAIDELDRRVQQVNADLSTAAGILSAGVYDVAARTDAANEAIAALPAPVDLSAEIAELRARVDTLAALAGQPDAPTVIASSVTVTTDANGRAVTTFTVADWVPSSAVFPSVNFIDDNGLWTVATSANRTVLVSMIRRTA